MCSHNIREISGNTRSFPQLDILYNFKTCLFQM